MYKLFLLVGIIPCALILPLVVSGEENNPPKELRIADIRFVGLKAFSTRKVLRKLKLEMGIKITEENAIKAADDLVKYYEEKYYYETQVEWSLLPTEVDGWADFIFDIKEGNRGVVTSVEFEGNILLSTELLEQVTKVKPQRGILASIAGREPLRIEELAKDFQAIQDAYIARGYMDIVLEIPKIEKIKSFSLRIVWRIKEEGIQYRVGQVSFTGTNLLPKNEMLNWANLWPGEFMAEERINQARGELIWVYKNMGFPFVEVVTEWEPMEIYGVAKLIFSIMPGDVNTISRLLIKGNSKTQTSVIEKEIEVRPGDVYNEARVVNSKLRLENLEIFDEVNILTETSDAPSQCDLTVEVKEKRTGYIQAGISVGSVEGGAIALEVDEKNLQLSPPFRGNAYQIDLAAQVGTKHRDLDINFINPYIHNSSYFFRMGGSYHDTEYLDNYSQRIFGPSMGVGQAIARNQQVTIFYEWSHLEIYDVDSFASQAIKGEEGTKRLGSIGTQYSYDSRTDFFRPTSGTIGQFKVLGGSDFLGGNTEVYEIECDASIFLSPGWDHVLSLRTGLRAIEPYGASTNVPLPLRTFLGGPKNMRGFEYHSISPSSLSDLVLRPV